ncbi:hypothetical protein Bhyg_16218 [Pseudolycoriella hygida]|uniref:DUF4780 domain-containing protein n=1 Tax=Pseudolycoriella hygida TaxID=35572 RepID=A0A9Q0MNS1_9DIPT|nr:hypothetical protein Bhyg_16218 [Pseudolycoriella hygida]
MVRPIMIASETLKDTIITVFTTIFNQKRLLNSGNYPYLLSRKMQSVGVYDMPMHNTDHGHLQELDINPFSHLASEIGMDRPSANPFDKGVMPSFDDRAIDEDYRNEFGNKCGEMRDKPPPRPKRQQPMAFAPLPHAVNINAVADRPGKKVASTTTPMPAPVRVSTVTTNVPVVSEELDLDDIAPKLPVVKPSINLKPQINIRSQNISAVEVDDKPFVNVSLNKPITVPVVAQPLIQKASTKVLPQRKPAKPVVDYFGTSSVDQEADQKQEYFRESELEANRLLFGVEELSRPLTNGEISKRKKLILKLVDQKLKLKLNALMSQIGERVKPKSVDSNDERGDNFADQLENLVPDSIPDNVNTELTQNWVAYPSEEKEQIWNNPAPVQTENRLQDNWEGHPPMYPHMNPGWMEPQMNPFPPGVDPMHMARFPRMPPMRPEWNPNLWQPHPAMRPQPPHWQHPRPDWNMPVKPMNPHLMQPNINLLYPSEKQYLPTNVAPFGVPPGRGMELANPLAEAELALKEKEFLERMGTKRSNSDSKRSRSPKQRRRSPFRSSQSERERRKRSSRERLSEKNVHRETVSPSRLSSDFLNVLSHSSDTCHDIMLNEIGEPMCPSWSRSASVESRSEDLRVRLLLRSNRHRSRSPIDLRNKLTDRNDDLRNQLEERSRRRRNRSSSRDRSSKRSTKLDSDVDSEWIKFNNIVGMLMNIGRDADITSEEMAEKKEIMQLLLENPDLLELDEKFVYKFGKGRLTLAVKEAETILYPNGVPDERVASLISKKIASLSTEKKRIVDKDTVPIEWIKLGNVIDQVLHLTIAERKKMSDRQMIEREELLLKVSDDPKTLLLLGTKYGHRNVEWACKHATKILFHSDGVRDRRVDEAITKERTKALERIRKLKQSDSRSSCEGDTRSKSIEWNQLSTLVTNLVKSTLEKFEKMSREDLRRRDDLLVQMSRDPEAIRSNTKFTDNVDKAVLDDVIEKCKKIIAAVKSSSDKAVEREFERHRTLLINALQPRASNNNIRDQILSRITPIFGKKQGKWTAEEKKEREELTDAVLRDPESLKTNEKVLERIGDDKLVVDEIIADVKQILMQLDPSKSRGPKKFHISSSKILDIPFVVKIEDASDQLNDTTKTLLLKALRDMVTEIEHPPKPKLLQQRFIDKRVEVVCANLLTFEWLKRAIVSDFKDKWAGADLKIERVPIKKKIHRNQLKSVVAVFKDHRATMPFDNIVREIRNENKKLFPERWELLDGRGENGDYKKKTIGIDIESLAALEQMNRFARFGRSLIYFDIPYMGDDVPNFEATCQ